MIEVTTSAAQDGKFVRELVTVWVSGVPRPQGSKDAYHRSDGKVAVKERSKYLRSWQNDIRLIVKAAMRGAAPTAKPVRVALTFATAGDPRRPPDIDKLARGVLDALGSSSVAPAGIVFRDDCQVVSLTAAKIPYECSDRGLGVLISVHEYKEDWPWETGARTP